MADNALPPNFADKAEQSSFYLGLEYDLSAKAVKQKPINYESKNGNKPEANLTLSTWSSEDFSTTPRSATGRP